MSLDTYYVIAAFIVGIGISLFIKKSVKDDGVMTSEEYLELTLLLLTKCTVLQALFVKAELTESEKKERVRQLILDEISLLEIREDVKLAIVTNSHLLELLIEVLMEKLSKKEIETAPIKSI